MPFYIHKLSSMFSGNVMAGMPDGSYAYAVAEPYTAGRFRAAWSVLTGRAYAFEWPKAGDLETALGGPRPRGIIRGGDLSDAVKKARGVMEPPGVPVRFDGCNLCDDPWCDGVHGG